MEEGKQEDPESAPGAPTETEDNVSTVAASDVSHDTSQIPQQEITDDHDYEVQDLKVIENWISSLEKMVGLDEVSSAEEINKLTGFIHHNLSEM